VRKLVPLFLGAKWRLKGMSMAGKQQRQLLDKDDLKQVLILESSFF
jgi:hypothetical protein